MKKIIAGNWKMNGLKETSWSLVNELSEGVKTLDNDKFDMIVCPPFTLLMDAISLTEESTIKIGSQDVHTEDSGAYTGNVSADMVKDLGCEYVILGHSERRMYEKESNELVAQKAEKVLSKGLTPIICIGESLEDRESGKALDVVADQFINSLPKSGTAENIIVAYEPVWAIGTGKVATLDNIVEIHKKIRECALEKLGTQNVAILYGGSVKPGNAEEILGLEDVDGVLVGGAALKSEDFLAIAKAAC